MQEMARRVIGIGNVTGSLGWEVRIQCRMCGIGVKSPVIATKWRPSSQIKVFKKPIYLFDVQFEEEGSNVCKKELESVTSSSCYILDRVLRPL
jgi:hypothetical protein